MTDAQRDQVRSKRAARDKRRGVSVVQTRNENESGTNSNTGANESNGRSESNNTVGATMSRRVTFQNITGN